ncbi:MAG: RDD family protein [Caldimonas sp.]
MPAPTPAAIRLDTRYAAETPEGIALWLRPAGVVARIYAYLLDALIRVIFFSVCVLLLTLLGTLGTALSMVLFFLLEWLYPVAFELSPGAATPGKRLLGLSVVMDTGLPITPAASLTRNLLRGADFLPSLYAFGLLSMLFRHDFKRLGDIAAGTLVVHASRDGALRGTPPPAPARAPAVPLSARAQAAIVAWAGRVARLTEARADELAEIAVPVVAPRAMGGDRVAALVGVAHWLLGRR